MKTDSAINQQTQNKTIYPSAQGGLMPLSRVLVVRRGVLFFAPLLIGAYLLLSPVANAQDKRGGGVSEQTQDGIDWDRLVNAIIEVESGGNPNAYNKRSGCIGLMQINPNGALKEFNEHADKMGCKFNPPIDNLYFPCYGQLENGKIKTTYKKNELFNPEINKHIGTWYLHRIAEHYLKDFFVKENMDLDQPMPSEYKIKFICAAYNGGITRLKKCNYDINRMPKETQNYVRKVLKIYKGAK